MIVKELTSAQLQSDASVDNMTMAHKLLHAPDALSDFSGELKQIGDVLPRRINTDPKTAEQGLAKLVLGIIELIRELMERQAIRRIDSGSLDDEEIERLGMAFLALNRRMTELKATFGLEGDDLKLGLHLRSDIR